MNREDSGSARPPVEVIVVGSGFGGICMGIKLRQAEIPFVILEAADQLGGVWRDNTYPGSGCDVPSHLYSYSFEPRPEWTRKFATQGEIKRYLENCAEKYRLYDHIRFRSAVERADFDEVTARWRVAVTGGGEFDAQFLVAATGQLSRPAEPRTPGLESFEGKTFHSARWDHTYDLTGKRVAVVGTGASAIQFVPEIAPRAKRLHIFQRSAPYVVPKPDRGYTRLEQGLYRRLPELLRLSRRRQYLQHEARVIPLTRGIGLGIFRAVWRRHLHREIADERMRQILTPDYPIGCKRILISNDWYPALRRPNVEVIPARLAEVRSDRVISADGRERKVDAILLATGFAANDFLAPMKIIGRGGRDLREVWRERGGAEAYAGIAVSGFPNLLILYGPNTNLGHNSIIYMLEGQTEYAVEAIRHVRAGGGGWLDVRPEIQEAYNRGVQKRLEATVWHAGCDSWYLAEGGRNTNNWPGFTFDYRRRIRSFDPSQYEFRARSPARRADKVARS